MDWLGLVELELRLGLALFEDEWGFSSGILEIKILRVLTRKMFEAAFNTPSEFEERSSTVLQCEAGMVWGAKLSEVDAGSNLDDIGILDDSWLQSNTY